MVGTAWAAPTPRTAAMSVATASVSPAPVTTTSIGRRESSCSVRVDSAVRAPTAIMVISVVPMSRAPIVAAARPGCRVVLEAAMRAGSPPRRDTRAPTPRASGRVTETSPTRMPRKLTVPPPRASRIPTAGQPCLRGHDAAGQRRGAHQHGDQAQHAAHAEARLLGRHRRAQGLQRGDRGGTTDGQDAGREGHQRPHHDGHEDREDRDGHGDEAADPAGPLGHQQGGLDDHVAGERADQGTDQPHPEGFAAPPRRPDGGSRRGSAGARGSGCAEPG